MDPEKAVMHGNLHGHNTETLELCRALGLDGKNVRRIVIDIEAEHVAVAYVELYTTMQAIEFFIKNPSKPKVQIVGEHI